MCRHTASMTVKITIRDVPEEMRDQLAVRASEQGQSMQAYLLGELERIVSRPSNAEWLRELREWKKGHGIDVPTSEILAARDADRGCGVGGVPS